MLHPSYTDLMAVVNSEVEPGEQPVVQSRYSIVMATSKRARQIIAGVVPLVPENGKKPLSVAIDELHQSKVRIVGDEEEEGTEDETNATTVVENAEEQIQAETVLDEEVDSEEIYAEEAVSEQEEEDASEEVQTEE